MPSGGCFWPLGRPFRPQNLTRTLSKSSGRFLEAQWPTKDARWDVFLAPRPSFQAPKPDQNFQQKFWSVFGSPTAHQRCPLGVRFKPLCHCFRPKNLTRTLSKSSGRFLAPRPSFQATKPDQNFQQKFWSVFGSPMAHQRCPLGGVSGPSAVLSGHKT